MTMLSIQESRQDNPQLICIIIMSSRQKNNFNDRLKRLGCEQLQRQYKNKTRNKTMHLQSLIDLGRVEEEQHENRISPEIVNDMKREINALTHRLIEAQSERERMQEQIGILAAKIGEKDMESTYLERELLESHRSFDLVKKKLESAESQLENLRLRQKMEAISSEISKQQPQTTTLRHQKHRKGKFSAAVLPSAFGSQKKFEFHSPQLVKQEIRQESMSKQHSILRSPFSGYLIEEWQKTKDQRNCKQLQVANLQAKIVTLKKQITKQMKQIDALKSERPSSHELVAALEQNRQQARRYKMVLMKLRESEKKRREISSILKQKGEALEEDNFYGFSTIADINQMIQKTVENLEIEHCVLQINLEGIQKKSTSSQTQRGIHQNEKLNSLQELIEQLSDKLIKKEHEFHEKFEQMKHHYEQQINEYQSEVEDYRIKLQQYCYLLSKCNSQGEERTKVNMGVDCSLISSLYLEQNRVIMEKVAVLMEVNEQSANNIRLLQSENKDLTRRIALISYKPQRTHTASQIQQEQISVYEDLQEKCDNCRKLKRKVFMMKDEIVRLSKVVVSVEEQKEHFKHCYEELMTSSKLMEEEMHGEIVKLQCENNEKEKALKLAIIQLEDKSGLAEKYKGQASELETKLHHSQQIREKLQISIFENK